MKLITYIESLDELEVLLSNKALVFDQLEVIISADLFGRFSKCETSEMLEIIGLCQKNKIDAVVEWDALNQEEKFIKSCEAIERLPLHDIKAIRVQDPGAVHFIKEKFPWLKIQLILENGNHNLIGLKKWSEFLGSQCDRLILSNELSKELLKEYALVLTVPLEVLTFGRILLFYSPRKLLSPLETASLKEKAHEFIEASGSSEESPHSGFPIIENEHGTFMFNVKDLYLLDHLDELKSFGINHARVDLRFDESFSKYFESIAALFFKQTPESELGFKNNHPRPLIKGFYNINKTDVLFTKLKNKRTQRNDAFYIGEIVDVERDQQLALMIKTDSLDRSSLKEIRMVTPEGKEKIVQLSWVKSSLGQEIERAEKHDLVLIPYVSGVTVKTQVYLNPKT